MIEIGVNIEFGWLVGWVVCFVLLFSLFFVCFFLHHLTFRQLVLLLYRYICLWQQSVRQFSHNHLLKASIMKKYRCENRNRRQIPLSLIINETCWNSTRFTKLTGARRTVGSCRHDTLVNRYQVFETRMGPARERASQRHGPASTSRLSAVG